MTETYQPYLNHDKGARFRSSHPMINYLIDKDVHVYDAYDLIDFELNGCYKSIHTVKDVFSFIRFN